MDMKHCVFINLRHKMIFENVVTEDVTFIQIHLIEFFEYSNNRIRIILRKKIKYSKKYVFLKLDKNLPK